MQRERVTLTLQKSTLLEFIKRVEAQTPFRFTFDEAELAGKNDITIRVYKEPLSKVLERISSQTGLEFRLINNNIHIRSQAIQPKPLPASNSNAQEQVTVTGHVTDKKGVALPGVTVLLKGTTTASPTDVEGRYSIRVPKGQGTLVFSFIGYQTQEVDIDSRASIDVTLVDDARALEEVVVVAYGTTSKQKITSSVSTLPVEELASIPVQSVNDAIAGRVHGVIVTSSTGAPGSKSSISIRGGGTPLYVIDNIIRSQNDFQNLNPNDIESYSVLKDAAATSLYGALGGNGVVLVTTKKGKDGQLNINYSFNQIYSQPTIFPDRVSSYENLAAINEVYRAEGREVPVSEEELGYYRDQSRPFEYPNTDWQGIALKDYSPEQRHDLSLSAGGKMLSYYASGSYYHQGTNLNTDNNYNDRITYRLNTVGNFDNIHLKVTTGIDGFVETNSVPNSSTAGGYGQLFQHIQQKGSTQLAYNEFGLPYNGTTDNPAVELSPFSGYHKNTSRVFNSILGLEYEAPFLEGLGLRATGNYNMWNSMSKSWNATAPSYALNSRTPILGNPPSLTAGRGDGSTLLLQGFITYNNSFGDHNIDFAGGYEQAYNKSGSLTATRQRYQLQFDQFVAGPTVDQLASGSESENARAGFLTRLGYNFKSKYFLEGTLRYDGNDLLPATKQWGTFYAVSGGWALSEESFMSSLKDSHILDFLKIRGSYGLTGILDGIAPFQYVPGYNVNANAWVINDQPVQGTSEPGTLPSTNFSWFSIRSRNIGLDFGSLNNRLTGSVDYFYMRTTGYVSADTRYAAPLGIGLPPINNTDAALRREGAEFNIAWADNVGNFTYRVGLNYTYFNQLWEKTYWEDEAALKNPYTRESGISQAALTTGYISSGFYTNNSDLLAGARRISSVDVVAGDLRYEDVNGDGKIDGSDFRRIGSNSFPRMNFGTTIDLGYRGLNLSAVVMGTGNRDRYIGGVVQGSNVENMLIYDFQRDYWRPDNTDALYPRQVSSAGVNGNNNYTSSDFWILRSGFVRLKYLQVGYDLKSTLLKVSPFKQARVFVSGTNLLTSSKSMDYFIDPESNQNNEDYPIQRTFALGVTVGF
ncbi:SusC/RagA family TonB-linked outer membrane protein [Pontibacter chinhatensis]|uniref:TonB-linked outer membrane protein, SusC/RagA family n=1 Tax=Pontibacter chinhatensis TaxID=1436961 RepID=A0A1I2VDD0_9BACT|nr:TonB-dependent receptor [Pontibacter chinhatensis]SFG87212.1 TonB-linked outer membrane protein, SusC/RagA family [Pontibacter chinhatensis]